MKQLIYTLCLTAMMAITTSARAQSNAAVIDSNNAILLGCQQMPEYPGGADSLFAYIQRNLRYPGIINLHKINYIL